MINDILSYDKLERAIDVANVLVFAFLINERLEEKITAKNWKTFAKVLRKRDKRLEIWEESNSANLEMTISQ